jgi:RimJ/RimL family protein N-acetyltransferase
MEIRIADPDDAPALVDFFRIAYTESEYLLFEPDEYDTTPDQLRQQMITRAEQKSGIMLLCEQDGNVVGMVMGMRYNFRRTRHSLFLVLGVLRQWHRKGVGERLLTEIISWARSEGMRRVELVVDVRNEPAMELYKKTGFELEGRRRDARRLGDVFVDEYWMSKLLT